MLPYGDGRRQKLELEYRKTSENIHNWALILFAIAFTYKQTRL